MKQQSCQSSSLKIQHFTSLGSTNECARQKLKEGIKPPFWIVTDEQTGGRGRHGREWVSIKGNLFTSIALNIKANGTSLSAMSLVTALALYDAVKETAPDQWTSQGSVQSPAVVPHLSLKWPNDIELNNAKLGGILIENLSDPKADISTLIIGFGVNILASPVIEGRDTTCLRDHNHLAGRDKILNALIEALEIWVESYDNGRNLEFIKSSWLKRAAPLGTKMTVKIGEKRVSGSFEGLNEYGALKLKQPDNQIHVITGGEVI